MGSRIIQVGSAGVVGVGAWLLLADPREWVLVLVFSTLVYALLANVVLFWAVPRQDDFFWGIVLTFSGSLLAISAATIFGRIPPDGNIRLVAIVVTTVLASFIATALATKIGTAWHVSMVVQANGVSSVRRYQKGGQTFDSVFETDGGRIVRDAEGNAKLRGDPATFDRVVDPALEDAIFERARGQRREGPNVWPEHFQVTRRGGLSWHLRGEPGSRVFVNFDRGFDPFQPGDDGPFSTFEGAIDNNGEGVIHAAPTVRAGVGAYSIVVCRPGGPCPMIIIGGGRVPDTYS